MIGYVGLTGITTGAHLHFGVYRYGRAINPLHVVQKTKKYLAGKKKMDKDINKYLEDNTTPPLFKLFKPIYHVNDIK